MTLVVVKTRVYRCPECQYRLPESDNFGIRIQVKGSDCDGHGRVPVCVGCRRSIPYRFTAYVRWEEMNEHE